MAKPPRVPFAWAEDGKRRLTGLETAQRFWWRSLFPVLGVAVGFDDRYRSVGLILGLTAAAVATWFAPRRSVVTQIIDWADRRLVGETFAPARSSSWLMELPILLAWGAMFWAVFSLVGVAAPRPWQRWLLVPHTLWMTIVAVTCLMMWWKLLRRGLRRAHR